MIRNKRTLLLFSKWIVFHSQLKPKTSVLALPHTAYATNHISEVWMFQAVSVCLCRSGDLCEALFSSCLDNLFLLLHSSVILPRGLQPSLAWLIGVWKVAVLFSVFWSLIMLFSHAYFLGLPARWCQTADVCAHEWNVVLVFTPYCFLGVFFGWLSHFLCGHQLFYQPRGKKRVKN